MFIETYIDKNELNRENIVERLDILISGEHAVSSYFRRMLEILSAAEKRPRTNTERIRLITEVNREFHIFNRHQINHIRFSSIHRGILLTRFYYGKNKLYFFDTFLELCSINYRWNRDNPYAILQRYIINPLPE